MSSYIPVFDLSSVKWYFKYKTSLKSFDQYRYIHFYPTHFTLKYCQTPNAI